MAAPTSGRPPATSHEEIEAAAFVLFARKGFEQTTLDEIAASVGVGRRTVFRYFPSKNDIPWGRFDDSLVHFRDALAQVPEDVPLFDAVHRGIVDFNRLDDDAVDQHRIRMRLILRTPALQAHSALRYQQWRAVVAEYVAGRLNVPAAGLVPTTVARVSLALALAAYEHWLDDEDLVLGEVLQSTAQLMRRYVGPTIGATTE